MVVADNKADKSSIKGTKESEKAKAETAKAKKRKYASRRGKNCPQLVTMPAKEPNKFPRSEKTQSVLLMPMSTNALYVRSDDIPWLLTYLADECDPGGSQGVRMFDDEDEGGAPICTVDGLDLKVDSNAQTLTTTALSGPLTGKVWKLNMRTSRRTSGVKWSPLVFRSRTRPRCRNGMRRGTTSNSYVHRSWGGESAVAGERARTTCERLSRGASVRRRV